MSSKFSFHLMPRDQVNSEKQKVKLMNWTTQATKSVIVNFLSFGAQLSTLHCGRVYEDTKCFQPVSFKYATYTPTSE